MDNDYLGQRASEEKEEGASARPAETQLPLTSNGANTEAEDGMEALLRDNDYAFRSLRRGETVEGTVVRVDPDEVLVDVGMKSEGVIPSREMLPEGEGVEPLHVGDRTLVYVVQPEGSEGHAILSLRRARMERSWREIEEIHHRGAIVEAPVVDHNKGGLIVDVRGIRGFVPVSQVLDLRNVTRQEGENEEVAQTLAAMQGRRLPLKVIEINRSRNRLILSERAAVQEQRTLRKDELMDQLEPGQVRKGTVSNITSFGAFVDLGGADGLVHVSELSYNRVNHPSEVLRVGQQVDVMVLNVDRDTKKIALSLKRAQPDPWSVVEQTYRVGEVVPATITKLAKFGAFARVGPGLEGLIHLSELTDLPVQDAAQVVREGDNVNVKIIHINSQRRRLGLSVRQAGTFQPQYQSFGEVDDSNPFGDTDMSAFASTSIPEIESDFGDFDVSSFSPENEVVTDQQDQPAAEFEPADSPSAAVASHDPAPVPSDVPMPADEESEYSDASTPPQHAVTE